MTTMHETLKKQVDLCRSNLVSPTQIVFNMTGGWWVSFHSPLVGLFSLRNSNQSAKCWANSPQMLDALDEEGKATMAYALVMLLRDKIPLGRDSRDPTKKFRIHWEDTGILFYDRISMQIRQAFLCT